MELTDIIELHTIELEKLPETQDGTKRYDWAAFINAETDEELEMIAQRNPQVARAIVKLRTLSADKRMRDLYERREKARRDAAAEAYDARQEGIAVGRAEGISVGRTEGEKAKAYFIAQSMMADQEPIEKIARYTGLTPEELATLSKH